MKVLVSIPNQGWIHKFVTFAAVRLCLDRRHAVNLICPTWNPYEHSLNRIAIDVLQGGYDYWLNIDDDNPPTNNPLDLLELFPDVLGCPTPIYHNKGDGEWPICWSALDAAPEGYREHQPREGLQDCDAVGSGCMIVGRHVLEGMEPPWFVRETDGRGLVINGPDFYFCRKAKAAGFKIQSHFGYPCRHFKEVELIEAIGGFTGKVEKPLDTGAAATE